MLGKAWVPLMLVTLSAFLLGCMSVGRKIDQAQVETIQVGKTTKQEVVSLLGSPETVTRFSNGDTMMMYGYSHMQMHASTFIPVVGAFLGGADTQHQSVIIVIGKDGVVRDVTSFAGADEIGDGLNAGVPASLPEVEGNKRPR